MLATKMLNKQKIEKQKLAVFLRDLSGDLNVNLKHMILESKENFTYFERSGKEK